MLLKNFTLFVLAKLEEKKSVYPTMRLFISKAVGSTLWKEWALSVYTANSVLYPPPPAPPSQMQQRVPCNVIRDRQHWKWPFKIQSWFQTDTKEEMRACVFIYLICICLDMHICLHTCSVILFPLHVPGCRLQTTNMCRWSMTSEWSRNKSSFQKPLSYTTFCTSTPSPTKFNKAPSNMNIVDQAAESPTQNSEAAFRQATF